MEPMKIEKIILSQEYVKNIKIATV